MLEAVKSTLLILTALVPIVNPLGNTPIFLSLTREYTAAERSVLSRRIALNSFILLIVSLLIGTHILAFFGISLPVVQVGGGLIVISTGWTMLKQKDDEHDGDKPQDPVNKSKILRQAFYPLTLPLTVGPGSIAVAITLGANEPRHEGSNLLAIMAGLVGSLIIAVTIYVCYAFAERLARLLGPTAMSVIMRLSSFLLVCIGVQILWNGVSALLRTLPALSQ